MSQCFFRLKPRSTTVGCVFFLYKLSLIFCIRLLKWRLHLRFLGDNIGIKVSWGPYHTIALDYCSWQRKIHFNLSEKQQLVGVRGEWAREKIPPSPLFSATDFCLKQALGRRQSITATLGGLNGSIFYGSEYLIPKATKNLAFRRWLCDWRMWMSDFVFSV